MKQSAESFLTSDEPLSCSTKLGGAALMGKTTFEKWRLQSFYATSNFMVIPPILPILVCNLESKVWGNLRESGDHDHFPLSAVMCISPELSWFSRRISHFISQWYKQWFLGLFTRIHISTCTLNGGNDQIPGLHLPIHQYGNKLVLNLCLRQPFKLKLSTSWTSLVAIETPINLWSWRLDVVESDILTPSSASPSHAHHSMHSPCSLLPWVS